MNNMHKGLFVVLEGGEGAGKTTQSRMLAKALELRGITRYLTREPGDTVLGRGLRTLLLGNRDSEPMSRKAEALLFAADRAEHVEKVLNPLLDKGILVICDRYAASTMAYQAYAGGDLDESMIGMISGWAANNLKPDITFFLDINPAVGLERARGREEGKNRFEDKDVAYHERVRRGFIRQIDDTWITVDAMASQEEVHQTILDYTLLAVAQQPRSVSIRTKHDYVVGCPACSYAMKQRSDDPRRYTCENGHGEMLVPLVTEGFNVR